jgi:large subunit ribosomal protein L10
MARPDKAAAVQELADKFTSSNGAVLTEYRGLSVAALRDLRRSLGEDATYAVTKNTLTQIAAREAGIEGIDEQLTGPTAIAFIDGDPVTVAKGLRDFAKANPLLVIKGGVLEGKSLSADEVKKLADLESRETLLAKLAGAMKGSLSNAASLFNAPLAQAARVLGALESKAKEDPEVIAGTGAAAAPDAEDAPATEATEAPVATEADAAPAADESTPAADAAEEK